MSILITGGAGFIGGHLAERFVRDGYHVTVLDNFDTFYDPGIKRKNVERAREAAAKSEGSYELVRGDVVDESTVTPLVAEADYVFHHAAQAGVRTSIDVPEKVTEVNVGGTQTVLDAARQTELERFVFAGSSSEYGKPEYLPYDEAHPTEPVSPYAASKLAADHYARVYHEVYGVPAVVLRYFTVYGPRMRPNMAITNFVSRCVRGEPPVVYGEGTQTRDFTYISDVVRANARLLETSVADGEVLNIGSTDNIDIETLAHVVRDRIDPDLEIVYGERNPGESEHTHADISKAQKYIDYEPEVGIRSGVERFIDWYRENEDWYDPLVRQS